MGTQSVAMRRTQCGVRVILEPHSLGGPMNGFLLIIGGLALVQFGKRMPSAGREKLAGDKIQLEDGSWSTK